MTHTAALHALDSDAPKSGIHAVAHPPRRADEVEQVEDAFIDAWARMAGAFAMDRELGRVHALVFVSSAHLGVSDIAARLGIGERACVAHLTTLVGWGVIHQVADGGAVHFAAVQDPWVWFLRTLRARRDQELVPIRSAIEAVRDAAKRLAAQDRARGSRAAVAFERIDRFASFVADFSKLADTLITLGAGPMLRVAKMTARFVLAA